MPSLRELQSGVRRAVVTGDASDVVSLLVGGMDAGTRLAIHHRHYQASLVTTLLGRFPATVWLLGSELVTEAAGEFVTCHPPKRPCIAEYGSDFPAFLASFARIRNLPYVGDFSELERCFGESALAVDHAPISIEDLAALDSADLPEAIVALQPGLRYVRTEWPVDELLTMYLTNTAPDRFELTPIEAHIEVRGARGNVRMNRITRGEFTFRNSLLNGSALGVAAERAYEKEPLFDLGQGLTSLFASGLVTAVAS